MVVQQGNKLFGTNLLILQSNPNLNFVPIFTILKVFKIDLSGS